MTGEPTHTASGMALPPQLYINYCLKSDELSITLRCQLHMFNPLHSSMSQEVFEKHLCNQNSHYKIYGRICYEGKPSPATTKSTLFAVSKNEWNTKEDTVKSMKNALYVLQYAKRHFSGRSDVEQ